MGLKFVQVFFILSLFSIIMTSNANTDVNEVAFRNIELLTKRIEDLNLGKIQFF